MKRSLALGAIILAASALQAPASADPVRGVIELFTSQSCSSCPPADKVFGEVIMRGDVLGLAYHVDYWNYLDWKDTFSSAQSTKRQYDYAKSLHSSQVYTPQMIVNGKDVVTAGSPEAVFKVMDGAANGVYEIYDRDRQHFGEGRYVVHLEWAFSCLQGPKGGR